jgi:peptide-methionine (S)-S-oxide reductase
VFGRRKAEMIGPDAALVGRTDETMAVPDGHHVHGRPLSAPWPDGHETIVFGMGCFWGAERLFWDLPGVYTTAVGYAGGFTPNPTYQEVCSGRTGHAEVVLVVFDPEVCPLGSLLKVFWEEHDPTQGMRQGNDVGTQYRSGIWVSTDAQHDVAVASREAYQRALTDSGYGEITAEIGRAGDFFYAEPYHQQYLSKNPGGYCNHGFCQVAYS